MRLPGTIKVGGYSYSIDVSEEACLDLESKVAFADHSNLLKRIRLNRRATPQQIDNDFLHETLHAIGHVYFDDELDEKTVSALANGLQQVLGQLGIHFEIAE